MKTKRHQPPRAEPDSLPVRRGVLWFALLGGGVAWTLQLLLAYAVSEFGCLSGMGATSVAGLTLIAWLLIAVSVGALALAASAALTAAGIRRRLRESRRDDAEAVRTAAFSGDLALVTNLVFILVILAQSVPIVFFLRTC